MKRPLSIAASLLLPLASAYGDCSGDSKNSGKRAVYQCHESSDVFLSSPNYSVALDFSALFLQPSGSDLHYAAEALPLPAPTPNWKIYEIHPDYRFGFEVGLDVLFHRPNTNLMLNWEHFHSSDSNSITIPAEDMLGPFFTIGPDSSPYNRAHGTARFHFDEVNLDYGLLVNFGTRARVNLFAGASYVHIKQTLLFKYFNPDNTESRFIKTPSRFSGAGPQVGTNFSYNIGKGFYLMGDAMASLLVGSMNNHTTYKSATPLLGPLGITSPNTQNTHVARTTQVVPGFEGKLGFAYSYSFRNHYMFSLEAGYEAQVYLNAIQSVDMGSEVPLNTVEPTTVGVYARTFQRNLSNFALAGPYAMLTLGF